MQDEDGAVFVLGGYQTDFARNWSRENKHLAAMVLECVEAGLATACIPPCEVGVAVVANFAGELFERQAMLGALVPECSAELHGVPALRCEAACASGGVALLTAMAYVRSGIADLACVVGVEKMKGCSATQGADYLGTATWYEHEAAGISFPFPRLFGRLADEYAARYGLDSQYLALIADKNYANARRNPNAQTRTWYMTLEHAQTPSPHNPVMCGMLKVSDCSQITDGAVSLFLASARYAAQHAARVGSVLNCHPRILGWGHTTAPLMFDQKLQQSAGGRYVLPWTRKAITDALGRARLADCWGLDLIETHDCFTSSEYMAIDHFGLTAPGESWRALEDGVTQMTGRLPMNPSGGLIGGGHPVGATGVRQVLDAYKQVTGQAGDYQVANARRAATLNIGGSATTSVCLIIGR